MLMCFAIVSRHKQAIGVIERQEEMALACLCYLARLIVVLVLDLKSILIAFQIGIDHSVMVFWCLLF